MKINGVEFDFSGLRASDADKMDAAVAQTQREAMEEKRRVQINATNVGDIIRGQCRILQHFLDAVLGPGACEKMGIALDDLGAFQRTMQQLEDAVNEERKILNVKPMPLAGTQPVPMVNVQPGGKKKKKKGGHR